MVVNPKLTSVLGILILLLNKTVPYLRGFIPWTWCTPHGKGAATLTMKVRRTYTCDVYT